MGRPATLAIRITADASRAQRGAQTAQRAFSGLTSTIGRMALAAGAAAGISSVTSLLSDSIGVASEVQQNFGALDSVFKGNAEQMKKWAGAAAESVGLSKGQYSGLAVTLGSTLKNLGISQSELGGTTDDLIKKAADLSSMFGGTTSQAVEALTSAFKGETDPIEKYGISINAASVKAYKASHASEKLTDTQARMALIMEQSKDSAGNFGKESDTLAGQQERLGAKFENLKGSIGEKLLPVMTTLTTWASDKLLPALEDVGSWIMDTGIPTIKDIAGKISDWAGKIGDAAAAIAPFALAIGAVALVLAGPFLASMLAANVAGLVWLIQTGLMSAAAGAAAIATGIWSTAQGIFNAVMALNPIVLVIAAIVALVAAVIIAYQKCDTFRGAVQAVWDAMKTAASFIKDVFVAAWNGLKAAVGWVVDKVKAVIDWFGKIKVPNPLDLLKTAFGKVRDAVGWVIDKVGTVIEKIGSISVPNPIDALKKGFEGIRDAAGWVIDKVKEVIDWIKKIPGGGLLSKAVDLLSSTGGGTRQGGGGTKLSAGRYGAYHSGSVRQVSSLLRPSLYVTIDGQQLQGRITHTAGQITRQALQDEGARLAAGGWV